MDVDMRQRKRQATPDVHESYSNIVAQVLQLVSRAAQRRAQPSNPIYRDAQNALGRDVFGSRHLTHAKSGEIQPMNALVCVLAVAEFLEEHKDDHEFLIAAFNTIFLPSELRMHTISIPKPDPRVSILCILCAHLVHSNSTDALNALAQSLVKLDGEKAVRLMLAIAKGLYCHVLQPADCEKVMGQRGEGGALRDGCMKNLAFNCPLFTQLLSGFLTIKSLDNPANTLLYPAFSRFPSALAELAPGAIRSDALMSICAGWLNSDPDLIASAMMQDFCSSSVIKTVASEAIKYRLLPSLARSVCLAPLCDSANSSDVSACHVGLLKTLTAAKDLGAQYERGHNFEVISGDIMQYAVRAEPKLLGSRDGAQRLNLSLDRLAQLTHLMIMFEYVHVESVVKAVRGSYASLNVKHEMLDKLLLGDVE